MCVTTWRKILLYYPALWAILFMLPVPFHIVHPRNFNGRFPSCLLPLCQTESLDKIIRSYENVFHFHANLEDSRRTNFETEGQGNPEMAYSCTCCLDTLSVVDSSILYLMWNIHFIFRELLVKHSEFLRLLKKISYFLTSN